LRYLLFGGEAVDPQWVRRVLEQGAPQRLLHVYGPTENTTFSTYQVVGQVAADAVTVPIGAPIANTTAYVLDQRLEPVPIGVAGELYLGGAGLAREYLRRPELTAEKFVPHPYSAEGGARLYRTGDQVRWLADGTLEFLGRLDQQVKLRGFRVELGEIESVLNEHEAVQESVVLARVDEPGERRLVAYVVAEAGAGINAGELRRYVRGRLPEYMVPSAFVLLDRLPLTTNGKVDRRALPAPAESRLDLGEDYVAPETEEERILAGVWAEVLHVERVGVCDNYFALGGDSIRSVRVLSLAKERGLSFSLRQLFQYQTIRELACAIGAEEVTPGQSRRTEPFSLVKDEDRRTLPADVVDAYPLSRLQLGMLYHLEATPGVSVYHDINTFHLKARLHEEFFVRAVRHVVARHDVLRTSFNLSSYSEPLQLVHREAELPLQFEDLRELSPADQQEVIKSYAESEQRNRFDLSRPTLLRFCIHRRTDDTFQFTLTACHAIVDGWSLQSTLAEIFQTYFASLRNTSIPEHKPFATSFRDFIALEQANLESEECRRFWRDSLSDATVTEIAPWPAESSATDRKRARNLRVHMPDEVSEGLHRLAVNAAVPLKSVLLAAHLKVMSLVMGQSDVITGLACNGRPEETDGELIRGLFLNVVPFRLRVGARSWTEFVRDTFNAERNLLPFRRYPLPAIQEQLNTPSFFETTFNYVHYHVLDGLLRQGDVQVLGDPVEGYEETNFTLNAGFMSDVLSSRITLRVAVDPLKVSEPQGEAIRGYYERVLAAMARDTLNPLETEPFLDDAERHKVLVEWNDTACDFPHDTCFHQLFERQVERTPDAEAVVFGDQTLSYRELNSRANRLAHHLRSLGVGPETLVGISVERSIEMVVGILGILKAGGAFVPLDPAYPRDRLAFMIEDSGIQVLLTQERLVDSLPSFGEKIIYLEQGANGFNRSYTTYTDENPDIITTPENAAYVIYTSGSTGTPKGVVIAHRGLCNLATAQIRAFNVQPSSRVLQFAALSFDASVTEFAMALLQGATLVIAPREDLMPGERLISLLRDHAITTVTFPPSVLALLPPEEFPDLRTIVVAGEACWAELVERWAVNGRLFCNAYGPTENTVCISIAECRPEGRKPTIGRALANVQVYVLDQNMRPTPLGVPGEIYAGGEGLARAYLNRPALTATRFVPNPYSTVPGARLYRTGDRGRYLPDGQLEFFGRVDHQVKLRGFRIELGEIEAVLCRHDAVRDAIVVAREESNGDKRLVAYVVGDAETGELRNYLHEQVPDYMVPSAWMKLDALPLTTNGKVDRKALPAPDSQRPELSSAYIAPRSAIERDIAAVWQEALGIENPGVNDNFFDLGGHSLQAVRVHAKLRAKFEKNLLLFELFQFPTIAAMAKYISNDYAEESSAEQGVERGETRRELRSRRKQMRKAAGES
jgi:amino acid adenylation domain-containing protein